ncbi:hypothetical protein AB0K09_09240 [Streptomyces sp. NPDC049577]|uniref:hypothetical protein n=1 Tax=Streptomyces sp. NPDC049577 TaxID=3155153 RepID=UPI003421517C
MHRTVLRLGLLAAGIAAAASAGPAQAASSVVVYRDGVRTAADHHHHVAYRDSFAVHQLGTVRAAGLRNQATATSAGCTADDACRSVALSFQIVTLAGEHVRLNAVNRGESVNEHCTGCQTLAGAYQFVVQTRTPVAIDPASARKLADIHHRLDTLSASRLSATDLKQRVDGLAAEVRTVLAGLHVPAGKARPDVTVHRHLQGWPTR